MSLAARSDQGSKHSLNSGKPPKIVLKWDVVTYLWVSEQGSAKAIWSLVLLHDHSGAFDNSGSIIFHVVVVKMDDRTVSRKDKLGNHVLDSGQEPSDNQLLVEGVRPDIIQELNI